MATKDDYGIEPETRAPKRNNTRLKGALCKHLVSVLSLLQNSTILKQIAQDVDNWLREQLGLEAGSYMDENKRKQIEQKNRKIKWETSDSYMNDYFAHQAGHHKFLDDKDIKKSWKKEMRKAIHSNPEISLDEFIQQSIGVNQKELATELGVTDQQIIDYFNNIGFEEYKDKLNPTEPEMEVSQSDDIETQGIDNEQT